MAQGAAIHAAILEAKFRGETSELAEQRPQACWRNVKQENVNSHGLGVVASNPKTGKTVNHVMIPRNSRLPVEVRQTFDDQRPNQQRVTIKVIEGDAPDPDACSLLGNCRITDLPAGPAQGLADRGDLRLRRLGPGAASAPATRPAARRPRSRSSAAAA